MSLTNQYSKSESILIINHDINDALQLDKILRSFGYLPDICTKLSELELFLKSVNPIITLLDFKTCFNKDTQILTSIKRSQKNVLSMVIIDNTDITSASHLFSDGIYDFINKPYIAENIKIRVKHCIDQSNLSLEKIEIEKALESSEQRYIRAIRGTNDGIWDWNINSGEIFFSNRWKEMLGYSEDLFPRNYNQWRNLIHPSDSGKALIQCLNLIDKSSRIMDFEYRILTKQNNYKWIHIRAMASYNDSGDILFISGSHSDIAEKKQTIIARQKLETQLRQSQKMKALGQLTAGIAHDFNNILASIMGYAELTKEFLISDGNSKLATYQDEVLIAGTRAKDLISQLLTYSRDSTGNTTNVSLQPLVKEVVKLLKSSFPTTIDITLKIDKDLPNITIDPVQIEQVIMNHCLNSKEAIDGKGQINLTLECEKIASKYQQICVSCHEMQVNLTEYTDTVHDKNRTGVATTCPDCHVPKEFTSKLIAKVRASKDLYYHLLGSIDTPEKYEAHRLTMAKKVWAMMRETDSQTCRSCHTVSAMAFEEQQGRAARKHKSMSLKGKTCIDCHRGIAHELPVGYMEDDV